MSKSDLLMRRQCFPFKPLSASSKIIQGQQARMFMPVCWLEEEDCLDVLPPPYCSNQQSTNQLTVNKPVEEASLCHFICGLQCAMQTIISIVLKSKKKKKGQKLLKTVHFWRMFRVYEFCKSNLFFYENVCSPDQKPYTVYEFKRNIVPRLIFSLIPLHTKREITKSSRDAICYCTMQGGSFTLCKIPLK